MAEHPEPGYRGPAEASADAEAEALASLGARLLTLRRAVLLPGFLAAAAAGIAGAGAHVTGLWAPFGVAGDGTYLVAAPTIAFTLLVPFAAVWLPALGTYLALRSRARRAWRSDAARRLGLTAPSLDALERMLG